MTLYKQRSVPYTKTMAEKRKVTIGLLVFFQMFQKYTKDVYMIKSMTFLTITFQKINAAFERVPIINIPFFPW